MRFIIKIVFGGTWNLQTRDMYLGSLLPIDKMISILKNLICTVLN